VTGAGVDVPAAIIFDMDGVLVDSAAPHRSAWISLLEELDVAPPREFWRLTIGRPAEEAVALLLGPELSSGEARRLARRKRQHYARHALRGTVAVGGVQAFARRLVDLAVPRAVATSATRGDAVRLIDAVGLTDVFDTIVTADDVDRGKPHPEVYLKTADALGVPPDRCLVFEDAVVGVQAARAAGMRAIGVTTSYTAGELIEAGAERAIADFEDLSWPP
jgi:beta-phosphoglucomutase-like phosphatase (HAD superfamily)